MKKKVLFVIHGLDCGGAEKSLISLLSSIPEDKYDIDLIIGNPNGIFMDSIPSYVHVIDDCYMLENFATPLGLRRKKVANIYDLALQTKWQIQRRIDKSKKYLSYSEFRWKIWGQYLPKLHKKYDLAISYMNGFPNYYVIQKTTAASKILWVHNEFEKLGYNIPFEKQFFSQADRIVTISDSCANNIVKYYPEFKEKVLVLENISSGKIIQTMAEESIDDEYFNYSGVKILSIGRLMKQKNFELAIGAAAILKEKGLKFKWYVLGEGELRNSLTNKITELNLQDYFVLPGIKTNPYPYIKHCDIFCQTSLYEGKSIALDEAKILQKPIVVTNYATCVNSIDNGVNGIIVDMAADSVARAIMDICSDTVLRQRMIDNLSTESMGNSLEINKYMNLMDSLMG